MKKRFNEGFTLIELIIVMVIMGVLASVAVPRYLDSIANAEESAENAVINSIRNGLKQYAGDKLYKEGRPTWPDNPFETLSETPAGYNSTDNGFEPDVGQLDGVADSDGEWTFDYSTSRITHQRADNSRYYWAYDKGQQDGDDAGIGSLGNREDL